MNKIATALTVISIIAVPGAAFASNSQHTATAPKKPTYAEQCTSLAEQWKTAEAGGTGHANLGKAKADAEAASKQCASKKTSDQKKGVAGYEAAIKLLGASPHT